MLYSFWGCEYPELSICIVGKDLSSILNNGRIWETHHFMSSSPTLHRAVCIHPEFIYSKKSLLSWLSESGMKAISSIRQLCLKQCFNILHAPAPIWCVTFPPWRAHHAYYCLLFWETPCRAVCRVKCWGFTERLCPPGPATQQLWLIKRILSTREKKTSLLCSLSTLNPQLLSCPWGANVQLPNANSVRSYRHYFPSEKCQMDGDFLLYDFTGVVTVQCERDTLSQFDKWGIIMKMAFSKLR